MTKFAKINSHHYKIKTLTSFKPEILFSFKQLELSQNLLWKIALNKKHRNPPKYF